MKMTHKLALTIAEFLYEIPKGQKSGTPFSVFFCPPYVEMICRFHELKCPGKQIIRAITCGRGHNVLPQVVAMRFRRDFGSYVES